MLSKDNKEKPIIIIDIEKYFYWANEEYKVNEILQILLTLKNNDVSLVLLTTNIRKTLEMFTLEYPYAHNVFSASLKECYSAEEKSLIMYHYISSYSLNNQLGYAQSSSNIVSQTNNFISKLHIFTGDIQLINENNDATKCEIIIINQINDEHIAILIEL